MTGRGVFCMFDNLFLNVFVVVAVIDVKLLSNG